MGASAGGHLALMQGTKGEERKANSEGPASESSKVQAVVAYFPPTDFVNYGNAGVFFDRVVREVLPDGKNPFLQALDYLEFDATNIRLTKVTDEERLAEHYKDIAPYYHVTKDDAPDAVVAWRRGQARSDSAIRVDRRQVQGGGSAAQIVPQTGRRPWLAANHS